MVPGRDTSDAGESLSERTTPSGLIDKAWKVVNSCKTVGQAGVALRYLSLMAETYPEVDVSPLVRELRTLFDLKEIV